MWTIEQKPEESSFKPFPEGSFTVTLNDCECDSITEGLAPTITLIFEHPEHGKLWQRISFKDYPKKDMAKHWITKLDLYEKVATAATAKNVTSHTDLCNIAYAYVYDLVKTCPKVKVDVEHREYNGKMYSNINPWSMKLDDGTGFDESEEIPF